jgi:hypothetical protein
VTDRQISRRILALAAVSALAAACGSTAPPKPAPSHSSAPIAVARKTLRCAATVSGKRPRDDTADDVRVRTAAHARISAVAHYKTTSKARSARADKQGRHAFLYRIGDARPGYRVRVDVRVSLHGRKGACQTAFTPRRRSPAPAPSPTPTPTPIPVPAPPAPAPTTASCYPLSDEGNCYEPGEYCRDNDHGASGIAGNGDPITCEDNNGWRWEAT